MNVEKQGRRERDCEYSVRNVVVLSLPPAPLDVVVERPYHHRARAESRTAAIDPVGRTSCPSTDARAPPWAARSLIALPGPRPDTG